jgi:hypothetical protein
MLALWIILALIALAVIASVIPFSLRGRGFRTHEDFSYNVAFHWLWRILGISFSGDTQGRYTKIVWGNRSLYRRKTGRKKRKEREKKKGEKKEKKKKKKGAFNPLRDREILKRLIKVVLGFIKDLLSQFRRTSLSGNVEIGFGDPAAMGIVSGFLYAIPPHRMMLDDLRITPNYVDTTFVGEIDFSTSIRPISIAIVLIKWIFHVPVIGLLRLRKLNKRKVKQTEVNKNGS